MIPMLRKILFCSTELWNLPEEARTRSESEGRRYNFNSLMISAISLKFGGMMHSTMEQIAVWNGYARPIFASSTELWNFQNRPVPRDDGIVLIL